MCVVLKPTESVEGHQVGAVAQRTAEQLLCPNGLTFAIIQRSVHMIDGSAVSSIK